MDKLSFDPGNWENVGAKLISKTMSSDFAFENGIEMNAVKGKCGEYEVSAADLTRRRGVWLLFVLENERERRAD